MKTTIILFTLLLASVALAQVANTTAPESTVPPSSSAPSTVAPSSNGTTSSPSAAPLKWIFGGVMTSSNVMPSDTKSTASGIVLAFYDGSLTLKYYVMHNVQDAVEVRFVNGASANTTGTVMYKSPTQSRVMLTGEWKIGYGDIGNLFNKMQYVDVTSKSFPNGEIRVTLDLSPYVYGMQYVGMLDFMQTTKQGVASSIGNGLMVLGGGYNIHKEYMVATIIHNLNDTTGASINGPADYCASASAAQTFPASAISSNGFILYQFSTMKADDWAGMDKSLYYVQLTTKNYPDGEIRGQIQPPSYYTGSALTGFESKACIQSTNTPVPTRSTSAGHIMGISAALLGAVLSFAL